MGLGSGFGLVGEGQRLVGARLAGRGDDNVGRGRAHLEARARARAALRLDAVDGDARADLKDARGAFERSRLALVRYLNGVDAAKCIVIGEAVAAAGEALEDDRRSGEGEAFWRLEAEASLCRQALPVAAKRRRIDGEL